jgi:hypothetical protein
MADEFFPSNSLVRTYRKFLEGQGKRDPRTDLQLTVELGNKLRASGDFDTETKYPDFRDQYLTAVQATGRGIGAEVTAGLKRGARGLGATAVGAAALGADLVGADETAASLANKARELESGGPAPTVGRMGDVRDAGSGTKYIAGKAGEVIPSIAEAILTSMIGAAVGTAAEPGGGTVAGAVTGLVGRNAVKQMVRNGVAKRLLGRELTEEALEQTLRAGANKALQAEFVGTAKSVAARMGGEASALINSLALSSGEVYNSTGDAGLSLGAGALAAIPDTILPAYVVRKFFPSGTVTKEAAAEAGGYLRRLAAEAAKVVPIEAGTESFQELVNIAAEKYHTGAPLELSVQDVERIKESAVSGAIGGGVAAPIAAAPGGATEPAAPAPEVRPRITAEDARRRVVLGQAPRAAPSGVQAAVLMTPEQQRLRLDALTKISTRTKAEDSELEVLRATLGAPAPSSPAPTSPPVPTGVLSTKQSEPSPVPGTPLLAQPSAPVAQPAQVVAQPTPIQLSQRVKAAGQKLMQIVNQVPSIDVGPVQERLQAMGTAGAITADDVTALETSLQLIEQQAGTEAARRAADTLAKKKIVAKARDEKSQTALQRLVDKATKKAETPLPGSESGAGSAPNPGSGVETTAPANDNLAGRLSAALNPPASPKPFSFGKVTLQSADLRPALNQDPDGNPRDLKPEALKAVDWEKTIDVTGALGDSGDRSKTRVGIALLTPDGRVLLRGLSRYNKTEGLKRVGEKAGAGTGPAVQGMGLLKGKLKENKVVDPAGKQQVLLNDVVAAGYVPIARLNFEGEPGVIREDFASSAEFDQAWNSTEKVGKSVAVTESNGSQSLPTNIFVQGDGAIAAAEAGQAGNVAPTIAPPSAEEAKFAAQAAAPKVTVRRVTKALLDDVEKAVGKKRMKELKAATLGQPITERSRIISNELESNAKLAATGDATLVEAALHRLFKPDSIPGKERGSGTGRSGGRGLQRTGPTLPNVGKISSAFFEKLHEVITRRGGRFDDEFLGALSTSNLDGITKLMERTGLAWPEFSSRIQTAFDTTENAADFAGQLKNEPARLQDAAARPAWQAREVAHLDAITDRLRRAGLDVQVVVQELLGDRLGSYNAELRQIRLAMEDMAGASMGNLVTLIHEVGHDIVRSATVDVQDRLHRAAERTLPEVMTAKASTAEEKLVETFAIKLAEEGFGADAPTIAQTVVRTIKDLYYRVAMALQKALGGEPSDALTLGWFENNLRRLVGGDFDYRFTDLFRSLLPEQVADSVQRFQRIDGAGVANFLDPLTRSLRQPVAMPDSPEAAEHNLLFREPMETDTMEYTEAMARVQAAGWNELLPVLAELKKDLAPKLTDEQFWKIFARGTMPTEIMRKLDERVAGATQAKIAGERMTEPMNQRARYQAFRISNLLSVQARRRAATKSEAAQRAAQEITEAARRLNKIEREFRDADAMNANFNDSLKDMVKEFTTDLDRGTDTAFSAGKLLGAIREMENLTEDQTIPEEYQRVFKQMLDTANNSVFDYLSGIARLDLPLGRMTVGEIVEAVKKNAPTSVHLQSLVKNRPMLLALASLARQSSNEMDLLQLRVMKDTASYLAIKQDLDTIRLANDEKLDELTAAWKTAQGNQGLRDRLRKEFLDARRKFRNKQRVIQRSEETGMIAREVADRMAAKATDLSRDVGAFSFWEPTNGATYKSLRLEDGEWKAVDRKLRMVGPDISEQFESVREDIRWNNHYLESHREDAGTRIYEEVKRQTEELSMLDLSRQQHAAHRFWLDKVLQPIGQKFSGTGTAAGGRVQQMLNRFQFISRTHADEVEAKARRWTKALQEASDAAGYAYYKQFFQDVYDQVIYHVESQPGLDEASALREAVRAAKRRIPEGFKVADNFAEKLANLLRQTKDISEGMNRIAEQNGIYIEDRRIKDPLTQKGNLQRHAIKYGWLTSTRKLRSPVIQTLVHDMQKAGWTDDMFGELDPATMDQAQWEELIATYFPEKVVREFVAPFVNKPGKEVFFGATQANGDTAHVSQIEAQDAWEAAGGNVLQFIDNLFISTMPAQDPSKDTDVNELLNFRKAVLARFADLYRMESKLAAESSVVKSLYDPFGPKAHRLMDGRTNDLIPPEHFEYDVFDPASARIGLAEIAFHSAFGRNGKGLDATLSDVKSDLAEKKRRYESLPVGSRKLKKDTADAHGWNITELERATKDFQRVDGWMNELGTYFGGGNQGGAVGDAKALLELMNLNMALILNQPKSGLWNVLSLADFPIAFRGLGKSSLKASGWALQSLARNVFGSGLEAMGITALNAGEYAKEIGEVFEGRQTERLPWGMVVADIGKGGQHQEGGLAERTIQAVRGVQQTLKKGVKLGPGQGQFAGFNALWAPFNYINQQVASSIATANVQTFESIIKKAVDYYASHPEAHDDPTFRFTAEILGMKGGGFFSDEGAFSFFRDKAMEYRVGNIEDIARQAAGRKAKGERLLTRDQALGVAMMAMNEISLESSINSRPIEFFNNPVIRLGGLLLGWPLAKMNQVNQSLRSPDGQLEVMSMLKGLGVLAAWTLPVGLAYSLMMDWYDEKMLGKKSNLRGIDGLAAIPLIGPVLAAAGAGERTGMENILGMLERSARAGNVYGLGADALASFSNVVDPTSGQRDFSLDSRVLVFSQFANVRDAVRSFMQQDGTATYQSVGRPLLATMGGNGLLQYQQIANQLFGLDNDEARVTNRINVNNWLRAAGREAGLEMRLGAGRSSPTPVSVWVREMQLAAYSNDRMAFLEAYRNAVMASRRQGEEEPEDKILQSWKSRHPLQSVFRTKPSETEMAKLMSAMDDSGKRAVREAVSLYDSYTEMLAPDPMLKAIEQRMEGSVRRAQGMTVEQLRRQAATAMTRF